MFLSHVYQATVPGPNASMGVVNVGGSVGGGPQTGDVIASAMVFESTNVGFPVGTFVTQYFANAFTGTLSGSGVPSAGAAFLAVSGVDLSNTTILLTILRLA